MPREFKVGDRVRFKKWDTMRKRYGLDADGDINVGETYFTTHMKHLCGTCATISGFYKDGFVMLTDFEATGNVGWNYSVKMLVHVNE